MDSPTAIGLSGSPREDGKTEALVREVLRHTGLGYELVRLHDVQVGSCTHCQACRADNRCVLDDDWDALAEKILAARVLVVGGFCMMGALDSKTKAMMERFWAFRHHNLPTRGKVGAAVVSGGNPALAGQIADLILNWMRGFGILGVGSVTARGSSPCYGCPDAVNGCEQSAIVNTYGKVSRLTESMDNPLHYQLDVTREARILGEKIAFKNEMMERRASQAAAVGL